MGKLKRLWIHQLIKGYSISSNKSFTTIRSCPDPTCTCSAMPKGLNIDHKRQLYGTVAPYFDHVILHTGATDWVSRIENDERYPFLQNFKFTMKNFLINSSPIQPTNLLLTTSSFKASKSDETNASNPNPNSKTVLSIMKAGLTFTVDENPSIDQNVAQTLMECATNGEWTEKLKQHFVTEPIQEIVVLICGHANRDIRCGVMGPLLQLEFKERFSKKGYKVLEHPVDTQLEHNESNIEENSSVRVGLISHVGGHGFAGNVIIYIPTTNKFKHHPLAGKGTWYGRVEPKHVQGIIEKTIDKGVVIEELLRGIV